MISLTFMTINVFCESPHSRREDPVSVKQPTRRAFAQKGPKGYLFYHTGYVSAQTDYGCSQELGRNTKITWKAKKKKVNTLASAFSHYSVHLRCAFCGYYMFSPCSGWIKLGTEGQSNSIYPRQFLPFFFHMSFVGSHRKVENQSRYQYLRQVSTNKGIKIE